MGRPPLPPGVSPAFSRLKAAPAEPGGPWEACDPPVSTGRLRAGGPTELAFPATPHHRPGPGPGPLGVQRLRLEVGVGCQGEERAVLLVVWALKRTRK